MIVQTEQLKGIPVPGIQLDEHKLMLEVKVGDQPDHVAQLMNYARKVFAWWDRTAPEQVKYTKVVNTDAIEAKEIKGL